MLIRREDERPTYKERAPVLKRALVRSLVLEAGADVEALLRYLDVAPEDVEALAVDWGRVAYVFPRGPAGAGLAPTLRARLGREPWPSELGWAVTAGAELARFPALEARVGVKGEELSSLLDRGYKLELAHRSAGRAKDGAMDLRAVAGGYGWFQIMEVLRWVRGRLSTLDLAGQRALIRDFAPLLHLLTQEREGVAQRRETLAARRQTAGAEADAAEARAQQAERLRAYNAGEELPPQELLELALAQAKELSRDPAPKGAGKAPAKDPAKKEVRKAPRP